MLRDRRRGIAEYIPMKPSTVDTDYYPGLTEEGGVLLKGFDVFVFGVGHGDVYPVL